MSDLLDFGNSLESCFPHATNKVEPRLWIHRFVIWKGLGHSPVQNITFKTGLNIIWKSAVNPSSTNVLVDSGLTTVVRLLRYSLGEEHFGNSTQENVIRKKYKNGAVGIEIFVEGRMISVIRGFSSPERTLVSFDSTLEDLWRREALSASLLTGIEPFLEEMEKAIKPFLPKYCDIKAKDLWEASYGYIARDHESGFFDVVKGHSKKMQSQSADINRKNLTQNICALLGFENQHNLQYVQPDQTKTTRANSIDPIIEPQVILGIINNRNVPEPCKHSLKVLKDTIEKGLFFSDLTLSRQKEELEKWDDEIVLASEKKKRFHVKRETLSYQKMTSQKLIKAIEKDFELLNDQLIAIEGECPACNTSMCDVLARGCLLSKSGFSPESISKTRREKSSLLEEHTHVIKSCTDEMKELDIEIRNNDKLMTDAEKEMTKITKSIRGLKNHIEGDLFVINECKKWISIFEKSRKDNHNAEQELQSAISTEEMIKRMKLSQEGERLFMETYQQVVDEMIGKDVRAKVLISAENILLDISNSKQLTDPCASWIKLIAFDFATLLHSMKNNIPALGLLIHNTPRREDILESWYERIFTFPYALERSCGDAPLFQYIVATVSAPPQHLQTKEYVRMKLDPSLGDEGALFKETF